MRTLIVTLTALLAAATVSSTASAASSTAVNACARNANGKVRKLVVATSPAPACNPNTETPISFGADTSPIVGFAKVNVATSTVESFGGNGTSNATVSYEGLGYATVTFTGTFPAGTTAAKTTPLVTAQSNNFDVANAVVVSASATQIQVLLSNWVSNVGSGGEENNTVYVAVLVAP